MGASTTRPSNASVTLTTSDTLSVKVPSVNSTLTKYLLSVLASLGASKSGAITKRKLPADVIVKRD